MNPHIFEKDLPICLVATELQQHERLSLVFRTGRDMYLEHGRSTVVIFLPGPLSCKEIWQFERLEENPLIIYLTPYLPAFSRQEARTVGAPIAEAIPLTSVASQKLCQTSPASMVCRHLLPPELYLEVVKPELGGLPSQQLLRIGLAEGPAEFAEAREMEVLGRKVFQPKETDPVE